MLTGRNRRFTLPCKEVDRIEKTAQNDFDSFLKLSDLNTKLKQNVYHFMFFNRKIYCQ